ncbi:MAG: GDP-mannose 4,6-dehydratase [Sedimentisphaerales bacterium]|nr:GDP-mannose 4,6-dehydratase [Sedimentisphaerales bacterium]
MKILVTGGAGFIGSHLVERLLDDEHSVTVLDDLSTGNIDNLSFAEGKKDFHFVRGSVRDPKTVDKLVKKSDVIYHLAAAVGVQLIVDEPVRTIETNIHGSEVVLEAANRYKRKVLIASSSEVYGKSENIPFNEDDDSVLGSTRFSRWSYACSKAVDEFLAFAYYEQFNLPVVIVRIFNTVGPRQSGRYGMVLPRFVESALKNEPICIYGTGRQSRCFAGVSDVVGGFIALMDSSETAGKVFNIGTDEEITIEALADRVIEKIQSKSQKRFLSYEEAYGKKFDDMMRRVPSLERIKKAIGYEPKWTLDKILDSVINDIGTRLRENR